jgi:hypothetical protein
VSCGKEPKGLGKDHEHRKPIFKPIMIAKIKDRELLDHYNKALATIADLATKKDQLLAENRQLWAERKEFIDLVAFRCGGPCDLRPLIGHAERLCRQVIAPAIKLFRDIFPQYGERSLFNVKIREELARLESIANGTAQTRPNIICLCGSTRFIEQFAVHTWELERRGNIVLGCTLLPSWYCHVTDHFGEATGTKEQCDALHLKKIEMADEVFVLNYEGYIGESTRNEIEFATKLGKRISFVEPQP